MSRRRWWTVALAMLAALVLACNGTSSGGDDNGTGLPDGTVKSKIRKGSDRYEICVTPEGGGEVKCKDWFTKDEVKGCSKGSAWPDCYHLGVKKAQKK